MKTRKQLPGKLAFAHPLARTALALAAGATVLAACQWPGSARVDSIPGRSMVTPKLSPDGTPIAYTTLSGQLEIWNRATATPDVIIASLRTQVSTPQWTPDGQRIILVDNERINNRFREGYNKLRVIGLATRTGTFYAVAPIPRQISERDEGAAVLSPDGRRIAFIMDSKLHVMPLGPTGAPSGPSRKVSDDMADLPAWGGDSQTILASRPSACARCSSTAAPAAKSRCGCPGARPCPRAAL